MAVIQKKIRLAGSKGSLEIDAIFDSGTTYSCIKPEIAGKLDIPLRLPEPMEFGTTEEGEKVTANERVILNFYLNGYRFSDEFMLISKLSEPLLIGAATMQKWRFKLDFEKEEVVIDPKVTKLRLLRVWRDRLLSNLRIVHCVMS